MQNPGSYPAVLVRCVLRWLSSLQKIQIQGSDLCCVTQPDSLELLIIADSELLLLSVTVRRC